ncbi:hypothetical protein F4776DRAFT_502737 [Hypoxylon sp. NC0597]|nr:hypothetical protein F4776DRAFT_502737 [Hypoxylon sp. NC0597]
MTDRQITESTIGLAGRLSHLPFGSDKAEDRGWQSTRNFTQRTPVFKELGPRKTWRPASGASGVQSPGSSTSSAWQTSQRQQKWLLKVYPEARLGNECLHDELSSSHSLSQFQGGEPCSSSLFAIGELTDMSEPQRVSGAPLVAIATGEANDVLCLAKPSIEEWQWSGDDSVSLRLPNMTEETDSVFFEEELAGPIRGLKSVVDSKRYDPTRWVIVQRDSGTRVFQPEYRRAPTISAYNNGGTPSRIAANPLFFIPKDRTGGNHHSDAAFNPGVRSKPPQLGLIDECGFWSIWDIAHTRVRSSRKPKVSLSKCGHIEKGVSNRLPSSDTEEAQWHKMLWVGCSGSSSEASQAFDFEEDTDIPEAQSSFPQLVRSSTLLLCSPKLVRLLDLTNNSFLPDLHFLGERGQGCILDVHQNPQDTQYAFILTTLKLFVVRVYASPGQNWGETRKQWSIILAISHLRDGFDLSLKLSVAPGTMSTGKVASLVYIYSSRNAQTDIFCITMLKSDPSRVSYHREGSVLGALQSPDTTLQTMCLQPLPATLKRSATSSESARNLAKQQVRFYQLAILGSDMCFVSTLCVSTSTLPIDRIRRPDCKISRPRDPSRERKRLLRHIGARFVVPDYVAPHGRGGIHDRGIARSLSRWPVIRRPFGIFYEYLCTKFGSQVKEYHELPAREEMFGSNLFDHVHLAVEQAIEDGTMPATTLFQIIKHPMLSSDIDHTAIEWGAEIERLGRASPSVALLTLNQPYNQVTRQTNSLQELYSALVNMTANPGFSGQKGVWIQEARSTAIRQMACDIYLSLFGLVHRQVDLIESQLSLARDLDNMVIDSQRGSRAGSVPVSPSEISIAGSKDSKTETLQGEDPAMALLRSYTGTGKFVPAKRTALLDKWGVGANPDDYVFDLDRNKEVTPGMQRRAKQLARESRKRRRAETLLQRHKDQEPSLPATQPALETHLFNPSSQLTGDYSQSQAIMSDPLQTMSQPIPGAFGRRDDRQKKKPKRRKGGF